MTLAGVDLGRYGLALAITLAVEVPVVAAFFPSRRHLLVLTCALATTATHLRHHLGKAATTCSRLGWRTGPG